MRRRSSALALGLALTTAGVSGCGSDDFENKPRPPVPVQITGVITAKDVTISPDEFGAGPVIITVSNQTKESQTLKLEGNTISERVGPVNPTDTAAIQKSLPEGEYTVEASASDAIEPDKTIKPATIQVGPERESGSGELLLP